METIHIFHTNDVHSHLQYWPRMMNYVQKQRAYFGELGQMSLFVDIGDFVDRSNLYTEATVGKGNIALLNDAGYDAVTIGNNEGITLSHDELFTLYDTAQFDVIVSNFQNGVEADPAWLKRYHIYESGNGTKVGVIAATAPYELFYKDLGWEVFEPRSVLYELATQLRPEVDVLVCLSHLGITEDELLAKECPMIDCIFGAHTHHVFEHGKRIDDVLLTGGGKFGTYLGHLTIQLDDNKRIVKKQDELLELALLPEVQNEITFLPNLYQTAKEQLSEPLYQLHKTYTKEWFHYSPLADLFAEKMMTHTNADLALFNAGIFLNDLKKGYVTAAHLHEILPHPINLCTMNIKGSELKEIYMQAQNEEWPNLQLKGLGFRGIVVGKLLTYGFTMNEHRELFIHGELADLTKEYKLVTLDMFTFGFFFPSFKAMKKQYYLPEFLRDLLKTI